MWALSVARAAVCAGCPCCLVVVAVVWVVTTRGHCGAAVHSMARVRQVVGSRSHVT